MKKDLLKKATLVLSLSLLLGATGCQKADEKQSQKPAQASQEQGQVVDADAAGMTIDKNGEASSETFKPADYTLEAKDEYVYEYLGLKFKLTDKILDAMNNKDLAMLDDQSPIDQDLKYALLSFSKLSEEDKNAEIPMMGDGYVNWQAGLERVGTLGMYEKGMAEEEISKITKCQNHKNLGTSSDGKYEYYLSTNADDSGLADELAMTNVEIIDKLDRPENGFVLGEKTDLEGTVPFGGADVEDLSNIATKDIEGKDFTSADFADYDLTMVNVFATWCTACVKEIPDLVELKDKMKDMNVNLVGVVTDTVDDKGVNQTAVDLSKQIAEKTNANYQFLMPDATNFNGRLNGIQALPETFFVDKNGKIVGETYSGSHNLADWTKIVEDELAKLNK